MTLYASIAFICSLMLILSFFLGGGADVGLDGDIGPDDGFKIFSFRSLMFFGMGFGMLGALARYEGVGDVGSGIIGLSSGLAFVVIGLVLFRAMYAQQATTNFSNAEMLGRRATVTVPVKPGARGQVVAMDSHGRAVYMTAATTAKSFEEGDVVKIVELQSSYCYVEEC